MSTFEDDVFPVPPRFVVRRCGDKLMASHYNSISYQKSNSSETYTLYPLYNNYNTGSCSIEEPPNAPQLD
jgi:hypothetical protein